MYIFNFVDFGFRLLGVGYMGFDFRLGWLGFGYMDFDFRLLGVGYMGFDFRLGFGYIVNNIEEAYHNDFASVNASIDDLRQKKILT
ncbi:hypothetical protein RhiirA1_460374 [Rhizophagus irregularis]|uniref:Uncharacterized protein n=1 Tax=Rhizophagus irregularis TaxID=588596 RepID=A0A2N0RRM0_9GLOM|nr:hypothetical protein RhiirA1_460374 [Rhizophagus irregularis]